MVFLEYLFVFIFGLTIGSFLNSVIYRIEKGESFLRGRSYCPNCKHALFWQDLIPLLSFLFLRGKCRYCGKKISIQYPLVEIATGLIFIFIFLEFGLTFKFLYLSLASCLLIIVFFYDLRHYIIPDGVIFSAIGIVFLFRIFNLIFVSDFGFRASAFQPLANPLLSAIFAAAFFLSIFLISKGKWLGFGDVKLVFFMGLFLGYPNIIVALFLAFFIGAIIGVAAIISGKKKLSSEIPFGPFLVAGTFIALFLGQNLTDWYLNFLVV